MNELVVTSRWYRSCYWVAVVLVVSLLGSRVDLNEACTTNVAVDTINVGCFFCGYYSCPGVSDIYYYGVTFFCAVGSYGSGTPVIINGVNFLAYDYNPGATCCIKVLRNPVGLDGDYTPWLAFGSVIYESIPVSCTPTPSRTHTPTRSRTHTPTISITRSSSPSATPSATRTETMTPSQTLTPSPTISITRSPSLTRSPTPSRTASSSLSSTISVTSTPTISESPLIVPTPSLTPTRTLETKFVNAPCSEKGLNSCPDFKCVKQLKDCDVKNFQNPSSGVVSMDISVTKAEASSNVVVGVFTTTSYVGEITLPAGMLQVGWTVSISEGKQHDKKDDCGDVIEQTASPVFDITVKDKKGREVPIQNLKPPIQIRVVGKKDSKQKSICLSYSQDESKSFHCLSRNTEVEPVGRNSDIVLGKSTSDHLTSFAILLGYQESSCGETWSIITILSLSFLGSAIVLVFVVMWMRRFSWFQALVYGYSIEQRMSNLVRNLPEHTPQKI